MTSLTSPTPSGHDFSIILGQAFTAQFSLATNVPGINQNLTNYGFTFCLYQTLSNLNVAYKTWTSTNGFISLDATKTIATLNVPSSMITATNLVKPLNQYPFQTFGYTLKIVAPDNSTVMYISGNFTVTAIPTIGV